MSHHPQPCTARSWNFFSFCWAGASQFPWAREILNCLLVCFSKWNFCCAEHLDCIFLFICSLGISVQLASKAECFAFHCNKLLAVCLWFGCGTQKTHLMWWEVERLQRVLMNICLKWHKSVCRKVVFISFICLHCLNYLSSVTIFLGFLLSRGRLIEA